MASPKPVAPEPKAPERTYKVGGHTVTREEYLRFCDEMKALAVKEHQLWRVVASQMRPFKRY